MKLLTVAEVATICNVSRQTIYSRILQKELTPHLSICTLTGRVFQFFSTAQLPNIIEVVARKKEKP